MNNFGTSTSAVSATGTAVQFGGHVHGGNQAVTNAAVTLWAAGAPTTGGGYGTGATKVASTTTDGNGSFTFNTAGVSPCTTGQYLYITAVGGNTGAGTNSSSAMMAALPTPCGPTTGSTYVWINEVTTVAAVSALQQFMSVAPGASPAWTIGAPSTNVTGLANAFLTSGNLVTLATGTSAVSTLTNTIATVPYTTTVTPDFTKINTIADILSACVNTPGGNTCSSLFSDTTPTGSTAPTDTIQAAYYIATNPAGLTMNAHGNTQGSPYYLCATYALPAAPFQPTLTCSTTSYPSDWLIGVSLKAVNTATSTTVGTITAGSVAIDASGNVWTAAFNTSATGGSVTELNPQGQVILPPVTATTVSALAGLDPTGWTGTNPYTLGGSRANALAIDTNGNAWYAGWYGASAVDTANSTGQAANTSEQPIAEITPLGVSTGYLVGVSPNAIAIDGNNNVFFNNVVNAYPGESTGSYRYYVSELSAAGTPAYSSYYYGAGRGTNYWGSSTIDSTPSQHVDTFYNACNALALQVNDASETALGNATLPTTNIDGTVGISLSSSAPTTCIEYGAADAAGNIWGGGGTYLEYINLAAGTVTGTAPAAITNAPVLTSFAAGTGLTQGGLDAAKGVAVDGLGHVWVANGVSSTSGGVSEFAVNTSSSPATATALSPAGISSAVYGFGSAYGYNSPVQPVIDGAGNVWITTTSGSYLNMLVGAAAPVVTPISLAVSKGAIGVRP